MGQDLERAKPKVSLVAKMAAQATLEPTIFLNTIKQTVIKGQATNEQITAFLMVADRYQLDPVLKEIHAFADRKTGGVVPIVGIDGWNTMAQRHPAWDGVEFRWAEKSVVMQGAKRCPEWCECVVYRKDRSHPIIIREYLDECFRATGPWQSHTKRMLRHKAQIQAYRVAFGFSGLYDEDEAERIVEEGPSGPPAPAPSSNAERARQVLTSSPSSLPATAEPAQPSEILPTPEEVEAIVDDILADNDLPATADEAMSEMGEIVDIEEVADEPPAEMTNTEFAKAVDVVKSALDAVDEPDPKPAPKVTKKQLEALVAAKQRGGWTDELFNRLLSEKFKVANPRELDREQALEAIKLLLAGSADEIQDTLV